MLATVSPFPQYFDLEGRPLDSGYLYFGVANDNPETNPITVYWDAAGTQPADQPVRTVNGYTVRAGTPAQVFTDALDYSLTARDAKRRMVIYAKTSADFAAFSSVRADLASPAVGKGSKLVAFMQRLTGAVQRWVEDELADTVKSLQFGAAGNTNGTSGSGADDTLALQAFIAAAAISNSNPKTGQFIGRWYRTTDTLTVPNANWSLRGENQRTIIWCDHNNVGLQVSNAGAFQLENLDIRRVSGKTGVGLSILNSPEGTIRNVYLTGHGDGLQIQDSHLTTLDKVRISGNTSNGLKDLGRCFGAALLECNIIGNAVGADLKSDWKVIGGAIEQNTVNDLLVSTTADYQGKYWGWVNISAGCHMEGLSGGSITSDQIVVGPAGASVAGPNAKIGLVIVGSFILGNSATRTAINFRQGDLCAVSENYFKDYLAGATLIIVGAACTGAVFQGNRWDGTGTFKSINASATNVLDFETENATHLAQVLSLTHSLTNGGRLRGVNTISSASRSMNLFIDSLRNTSNANAWNARTLAADLTTLLTRLTISCGADIADISFPNSKVTVSGTYTAPFTIGAGYFWVDASTRLRVKATSAGVPTFDTDGVPVGTQT